MQAVNPAWETAPYRIAFLMGIPIPAAVKLWSRKRRRKWMRQAMRPYCCKRWLPGLLPNPELDNFDPALYHSYE